MEKLNRKPDEKISWVSSIPFFIMHLMPLGAFFTGVGWFEVLLALALYYIRMFFITAGYHRYFAHRSYKMNRFWQFVFAFGAQTSAQKGVLWWSGHHRHHHRFSDTEDDIHSPLKGFWWSHMGWILCKKYKEAPTHLIKDFEKYPELRWLERHPLLPPTLLGIAVLWLWGPSALFIGFFLSTVLLWHGTFTINSLTHVFGRRRYVTNDSSRNSFLLALITNGEGWHNNHHHFASSARQSFYWWEIDVSYYVLKLLSVFGIVYDLRPVPKKVKKLWRVKDGHFDIGMFKTRFAKATQVIGQAKQQTGEMYAQRKEALDQLVVKTKHEAERLAKNSQEGIRKAATRKKTITVR